MCLVCIAFVLDLIWCDDDQRDTIDKITVKIAHIKLTFYQVFNIELEQTPEFPHATCCEPLHSLESQ